MGGGLLEEIIDLLIETTDENERLRAALAQSKYHRTEKGQAKMQRNNEHRRIKTVRKKVLKELVSNVYIIY